ncbi:MAG: S8 family serine peptidase [Gammaproteobacteria bacterium]|nr:S8 family serine peptidase [Gammaproteobacteria bacterium]
MKKLNPNRTQAKGNARVTTDSSIGDFDPALAEEIRLAESDDSKEVSVIARLTDQANLPEGVKLVTRFGDVATLRVQRNRISELIESEAVTDIEASRCLHQLKDISDCETAEGLSSVNTENNLQSLYTRRPQGVTATGKGCVVAVLDWGLDIAFPAFRDNNGKTRVEAIWDQRGEFDDAHQNRWGYGQILTADDIDTALQQKNPYESLDYDPADSDSRSRKGEWQGSHGTHVMDIAAGNGRGGGLSGVAPEADLVFVHLSRTARVLGRENLGDSASVLEAIDFVFTVAGDRPCIINMSVGAHGGPHDGLTLVEQGIDRAVWLNTGRAVVNSAGNYFTARAHAQGRLKTGMQDQLEFKVPENDPTTSELEIYYESSDRFNVSVIGPDGSDLASVAIGEAKPLLFEGREIGYMYHRNRHNGNADRHVDIFIHPNAPAGIWQLKIQAEHAEDGRFHAWIERDRGLRPKFISDDIETSSTTGTLCNGKFSITVGAFDPHQQSRPMGQFSSAGPTRDGRIKPEIVAPGVRIYAAQSTPPDESPAVRYTSKNGTSMAAPHVTGAIAIMFEAAGRPMDITDTRALLFSSTDCTPFQGENSKTKDLHRLGYGYLDIAMAEKACREWGKQKLKPVENDEQDEEISDFEDMPEDELSRPVLTVAADETEHSSKHLKNETSITDAEACYEDEFLEDEFHENEDLAETVDSTVLQILGGLLPDNGPEQLFQLALSLSNNNQDATNLTKDNLQALLDDFEIKQIEEPYAEEA